MTKRHASPSIDPSSAGRRADAQRNRARILEAAHSAFANPDAVVSMAQISRLAGVGMATLYRNFPSRRELLEALYIEEVDAICEAAKTIDAGTPGETFVDWLHRFYAFFMNKHDVASELLEHADTSHPVFGESRARVIAAGRPLLRAAQASQEVCDDLGLEQMLDMIIAVATIHGDPKYVEPIVRTTISGLRVRRTEP